MYSLKVNPSFDETALKLFFEIHDVFLKAFCFLHLSAFYVILDVQLIDLVYSEPTEVVLGLRNHRVVVILIYLPESKRLQLTFIDRVLVLFVKYEV